MNTPVLEVTNLSKNFGGLRAINRQEIVALIGPNGAGKTTFFNCITGIYLPTEGTVQLHLPERNGKPASSTTLNGMKPNEITSLGMARTFQNIRLFPTMTVLENVMIGRHCRTSAGIAGAVFQDSRTKAEEQATIDRSYELLREVGLNMHYQDEARNLPYGAQLLTYMQTVRFLADYLDGDNYYKIKHPEHNWQRSKAQFKLLQSIEAQEKAMNDYIAGL